MKCVRNVALLFALLLVSSVAFGPALAQPRGGSAPPSESVPEALSRLGEALERGVQRGLRAAEHGLRAGAVAAARGVERGANAAAKAAERVARELEKRSPAPLPPGAERTTDPSASRGGASAEV